jgi:hypothetical protein
MFYEHAHLPAVMPVDEPLVAPGQIGDPDRLELSVRRSGSTGAAFDENDDA